MNILNELTKYEPKEIKYTISKIKEKENCAVLYIGKNTITVSIDDYFKYGLRNLKGLDDFLYEELKNHEKLFLAYNSCLRKLSIREHSAKQIKTHLYNKFDLEDEQVDSLINKLKDYDLLNENRYASSLVSSGNYDDKSYNAIKNKMIADGLNSSLIEETLHYDYDEELKKAIKIASKANSSIKNKATDYKKTTILNRLISLGFSYDIGKNAVNNIGIICDNEGALLDKEFKKALNKYSKKYDSYDLRNHIYAYLKQKGFKSNDIITVLEELNG